ncbi:UNVERIFIED_CONTAM: hypothetical protein GTU68_057749, partial [Idotea baltica]|nr:hypothetical protein [Idotea baltica]
VTGAPYESIVGYCRAVRIGPIISVSGTAPIGPGGKAVHVGDPYNQTKYCLGIIQRAIEDAGGTLADVVRTRIFVTDVGNWEAIGRAHGEYFAEIQPATSMVGVCALIDPEWLVEIEAECYMLNS